MEIFLVLLLIVFVIIVLNQNSNVTHRLKKIDKELSLLRKSFQSAEQKNESIEPVVKDEPSFITEAPKPYQSIFSEASVEKEEPIEEQPQETVESLPLFIKDEPFIKPMAEPARIEPAIPSPSFFERHPDMEKFIGENLVSKIGIAVLVLAIGFFVKYAIDQNWIGPVGRVSVGILCGGILIAIAHRLRNSYRGFSSVLAGGGLAVFYFTITLAFHQFQLFGQTTAFVIMLVITIFAVILSLLYNKQELAVIALVGGFIAPFLVSTGSGNYQVLFTYLIILNSGLLAIAYNKSWRLLNLLSFIFTVILFGSWFTLLSDDEGIVTYRNGFLFATVFYCLFFVINIAHNIKEKRKFIASDFGILLANTSLYFCVGILCLNNMHAAEYKGLFSAVMGIFNLVATYFLFRKQKVDNNILYLLIGITLTFISITAPIQLHGNHITIFWASEAVLLYWLSIKSKIKIIQYSSVLVWVLMLISLFIDWTQIYMDTTAAITIVFNKGFITTLFAAVTTYFLFLLRNKEENIDTPIASSTFPGKNIFRLAALSLLFIAGALEINYQFDFYYAGTGFNLLYELLYTIVFINTILLITNKIKNLEFKWYTQAAMLVGCILFYLLCLPQTFKIQSDILIEQKNGTLFWAHWMIALLIAVVIFLLIQLFQSKKELLNDSYKFITWMLCAIVVFYFSTEIGLFCNHIFYSATNPLENIQRIYIKTGLPILWGVCSFLFMWLGMRYKYQTLRIISLSLFTLTLLKLFIFDIRNIPAGGKIAAFFCLGILLLVVSFMYQRLKKIIIDNEEKMS